MLIGDCARRLHTLPLCAGQIYWGTLVFKQVLKALGIGAKAKARKTE